MRLERRRLTWPVLVAVGVVLVGGGATYAAVSGEETPDYRTVAATRGDVEQTLTLSGLVDAARRSDLAFGTDGTVAKVRVAQGQKVKAGQVVAVLETESLDAAVTDAEATLAQAKAQLASDQDAQTSSVSDAASSPTTPTGASKPSASSGASPAVLAKLTAQQQAVLKAQSAASAALAAAKAALAAQTTACADAYQATTAGEDPAAADTRDDQDAACDAALADVQAEQAAVKDAQDALADALTALSSTLSGALGSVAQASGTPQQQARTSAADTPASSGDGATSGSTGGTVTAARLASDQAQIDQAEADLITARAARAQATLRSTRTGTLASLDLAVGDQVSAGTAVAVVVGGRAVTLTGTVPEDSVRQVKVGQTARVTVPGATTSTQGTVTAIGMTADSSTGSTTYPVTITVEDPTIALPTGSRAQVSIVLATADDVVTVPTSAVSRTGGTAVVRTWDGKNLARTQVTLGAVGARSVEVTDGLEAGTQVVLADVGQAITGASDELNQRGGFGPGGGPVVEFRAGNGGGPVTFGGPGK